MTASAVRISPELASKVAGENLQASDPLAFQGQALKIPQSVFDRWRRAFPNIPDLVASLQVADDYFADASDGATVPMHRVSRWLERDNATGADRAKDAARLRGDAW